MTSLPGKSYPLTMRISFFLLSLILFFYGIIVAKDFLYPISFGVLIAYLLYPLVNFLETHGFPRILSILLVELLTITLVVFIFSFVYGRLVMFVDNFPSFKLQASKNIDLLTSRIESRFGLGDHQVTEYIKGLVQNFFDVGSQSFARLFQATAGTILVFGLLPVYVFLFLYYRTKFAYFIFKIVPRRSKQTAITVLKEISQVATNYMGGVLIVVIILCILNSFGLYIIGMKYAITLGIISALFNLIPYFGTLAGGSVPLLFALLLSDNPMIAIRVVFLFIVVQFIENNILTPNIVGGNLRINPFFIIFSLILAALVWGIPGMLVIVPFLAIFKIICKHSNKLEPISFLLGNNGTRKHAITFKKIVHTLKKQKH